MLAEGLYQSLIKRGVDASLDCFDEVKCCPRVSQTPKNFTECGRFIDQAVRSLADLSKGFVGAGIFLCLA